MKPAPPVISTLFIIGKYAWVLLNTLVEWQRTYYHNIETFVILDKRHIEPSENRYNLNILDPVTDGV
jgi:hypothetical protein